MVVYKITDILFRLFREGYSFDEAVKKLYEIIPTEYHERLTELIKQNEQRLRNLERAFVSKELLTSQFTLHNVLYIIWFAGNKAVKTHLEEAYKLAPDIKPKVKIKENVGDRIIGEISGVPIAETNIDEKYPAHGFTLLTIPIFEKNDVLLVITSANLFYNFYNYEIGRVKREEEIYRAGEKVYVTQTEPSTTESAKIKSAIKTCLGKNYKWEDYIGNYTFKGRMNRIPIPAYYLKGNEITLLPDEADKIVIMYPYGISPDAITSIVYREGIGWVRPTDKEANYRVDYWNDVKIVDGTAKIVGPSVEEVYHIPSWVVDKKVYEKKPYYYTFFVTYPLEDGRINFEKPLSIKKAPFLMETFQFPLTYDMHMWYLRDLSDLEKRGIVGVALWDIVNERPVMDGGKVVTVKVPLGYYSFSLSNHELAYLAPSESAHKTDQLTFYVYNFDTGKREKFVIKYLNYTTSRYVFNKTMNVPLYNKTGITHFHYSRVPDYRIFAIGNPEGIEVHFIDKNGNDIAYVSRGRFNLNQHKLLRRDPLSPTKFIDIIEAELYKEDKMTMVWLPSRPGPHWSGVSAVEYDTNKKPYILTFITPALFTICYNTWDEKKTGYEFITLVPSHAPDIYRYSYFADEETKLSFEEHYL